MWDMGDNIFYFSIIDFDVIDIINFIDSLCMWLDCENSCENEVIFVKFDF